MSIYDNSFANCANLSNCTFRGSKPQTGSSSGSYVAFYNCAPFAHGYYPLEFSAEWKSVIDPSTKKWQGLIMEEIPRPVLNAPVVNEEDATVDLSWSMDYASANLRFDVYRSTSGDFSTASVIGANISEKTFKDETWLQAFSSEDTLYYWVVAKDGDYEIGRSDEKSADLSVARIPAAPVASDILFVASSPTGYKPANGGVSVKIPIGRYLGDTNRLVKSGALASQVVLEVMQTKDIPVGASVVLNGVPIAGGYNCSTSATDIERWNRIRYSVDVGALKLPVNRGVEVVNTIEIVFDEGTGRETVAWAALYIPVAPPVVLAHGINSSAGQLKTLKGEIEDLGIPTVSDDFVNHGNNAISDIADLTRLVDQAKRDFGVETVNVVGHSMGGLRAREYVQKHKRAKDVMKVLQVASPNGGSPVADFVVDMKRSYELAWINHGYLDVHTTSEMWSERGKQALRDLSNRFNLKLDPFSDEAINSLMTQSMADYNRHTHLAEGVEYGVVAGLVTDVTETFEGWDINNPASVGVLAMLVNEMSRDPRIPWLYQGESGVLGKFIDGLTDINDISEYLHANLPRLYFDICEGDLIVPVSSAFTLVPPLGGPLTGTFKEVWHSGLILDGVKRTMALLTPKLIDHKTCEYGEDVVSRKMLKASQSHLAVGSHADNGANESLLVSSTNGMSLVSGILDPNTNYTVSVGVCAGNLSVFAFQQTGTCIDMNRVELYDPSGRRVVENKDVFMTNDEACVFCVLRNPTVGNWQMKFSTGDCDGEDLWTLAFHEVDSPVVVEVDLARSEIVVGDVFELTVCAKNGNSPLYGMVDVTMTSPSGEYSLKAATSIGGGRYRCNLVAKEKGEYSFGVQFNTTNPLTISRLLSFGACAVEGSSGNKITYLPGEQCDGDPVEQEKPSGMAVKLRGPTFLRENYLQVGWIDSMGSGQTYEFGECFTNDVDLILLPVWKQRQDAVSQALGFDEGSVEISGEGQWLLESGGSVVRGSILSGQDNAETSMSAIVDGGGFFSFMIKTSCEPSLNAADGLRDHAEFLVDGEVVAMSDGESVWKRVSVDLSGGKSHTVTWRYVKDGSGSAGEDCVWISDIQFASLADELSSSDLLDELDYNWFYETTPTAFTESEPFEYNPVLTPENAICQIDICAEIGEVESSALLEEDVGDAQAAIVKVAGAFELDYAVLTADGWTMVGNGDLGAVGNDGNKISVVIDYAAKPSKVKYMVSGHTLTNADGVALFECAAQKSSVQALVAKGDGTIDCWAGKYEVVNSDVQFVEEGSEIELAANLDAFPSETFQVSGGGTLVIPSDKIPVGGVNRKIHVDGNSKVRFDLSGSGAIPSVTRLFNGVGGAFVIGDNIQLVVPGEGVERVSKLFVKDGNLEARVAERPTIDNGDGSDSAFKVNADSDSTAVSASIGNAVEGFWYGFLITGVLTSDFVLDPDSVKQCTGTGSLRLESSANANSDSGFYRVSVSAEKP